MSRDQEQGARRQTTNPAGNLHRPSLPSIRVMFPDQWADQQGGSGSGRGMPPYPQGQRSPYSPPMPQQHQQGVPPYPQPSHPQYAARGTTPSMYSPPPPQQRYNPSTPAPGLMQRPRAQTPPPGQPSYPQYAPQHPNQYVYPPHPTTRPPAPPAAAPGPGGNFILLEPNSASGSYRTKAQSSDPRGLSSIHNFVAHEGGAGDGRHVCHICGHSFDRPSTLRTHINAHEKVKPYLCSKCRRGFSASSNMRRHERKCQGGQGSSNDPQSPSSPSSTSS
ncbi:hypothetical protein EXIGLDRAFT_464139 [Exidia glandulosa HHB12029]|uniref:C2H2-type domain-containing protein n=1 Tax=Exidia glandulosa HHB12029 TaxID=1314781 RepID=A0A165AZ18_EXIGL|nr:hypothetical protein EXIGLDRAFT_464139 [Exidia glandulosa HHB12029]